MQKRDGAEYAINFGRKSIPHKYVRSSSFLSCPLADDFSILTDHLTEKREKEKAMKKKERDEKKKRKYSL